MLNLNSVSASIWYIKYHQSTKPVLLPSDTQLYELNFEGFPDVTCETPPVQKSLKFLMIEVTNE